MKEILGRNLLPIEEGILKMKNDNRFLKAIGLPCVE
jgi:hypothetical protein